MDKSRVYVETTIPSFYYDARTTPEIIARRTWTREWWAGAAERHELVTSEVVLDELGAGPAERQAAWTGLLANLPLLKIQPAIAELAETYIRHRLMPAALSGDVMHLALASYYECDFLVTWNCKHLANANKFGHIRRVNTSLGFFVPALVTPQQILGDDDGSGNQSYE